MSNPLLADVHYEFGTPYATTCYGWDNNCDSDAEYTLEYTHVTRGYSKALLCASCLQASLLNIQLPDPRSGTRRASIKPFTSAELQAKANGTEYLRLAHAYRLNQDVLNAVSCCLEGLQLLFGVTRPLMVRDQLHDLLRALDPAGTIPGWIKWCTKDKTQATVLRPSARRRVH